MWCPNYGIIYCTGGLNCCVLRVEATALHGRRSPPPPPNIHHSIAGLPTNIPRHSVRQVEVMVPWRCQWSGLHVVDTDDPSCCLTGLAKGSNVGQSHTPRSVSMTYILTSPCCCRRYELSTSNDCQFVCERNSSGPQPRRNTEMLFGFNDVLDSIVAVAEAS